MNITLEEMVLSADSQKLGKKLLEKFPSMESRWHEYVGVIDILKNLDPETPTGELCISVVPVEEEWDTDRELYVNGIDKDSLEVFSLDYLPWSELLGYKVLFQEVEQIDALAEIIYELTLYGTTPKEVEEKRELMEEGSEIEIDEDEKLVELQINGGIILPFAMTEEEATKYIIEALEREKLGFSGIVSRFDSEEEEVEDIFLS